MGSACFGWGVALGVTCFLGCVLYGLHKLCVRLEERGLLYYRRRSPGGGVSHALMELDRIVRPTVQHVREVEDEIKRGRLTRIDGD
jgi:hypothetical protein